MFVPDRRLFERDLRGYIREIMRFSKFAFCFMELKRCTTEFQRSNFIIIISTVKLLQTKQLCDLREVTELPITL